MAVAVDSLQVSVGKETVNVEVLPTKWDLRQVIAPKTEFKFGRKDIDDPFYVVDLGRIVELKDLWDQYLPQVKIFYAMKCNHDLMLLKTLAALGVGFDCACKHEVETVLDLGVSPDRIVFANPIKQMSHIQYAAEAGVDLMTFDTEPELLKIKKLFPSARLILRVAVNPVAQKDPSCPVNATNHSAKFGASSVDTSKALLLRAKALGLNVVGISFQSSTGDEGIGADSAQYKQAIEYCDILFQYGAEVGCDLTVLDLGGGFSESEQLFRERTSEISKYVTMFTEKYPRTEVIAEPGRYFAGSPYTLSTCIISKDVTESGSRRYCITESTIGGSLGKKLYHPDYPFQFHPVKQPSSTDVAVASVWGRTCAPDYLGQFSSADLEVGDWIYFENNGAYTLCIVSSFHSFPSPVLYYYFMETHRKKLCQLLLN